MKPLTAEEFKKALAALRPDGWITCEEATKLYAEQLEGMKRDVCVYCSQEEHDLCSTGGECTCCPPECGPCDYGVLGTCTHRQPSPCGCPPESETGPMRSMVEEATMPTCDVILMYVNCKARRCGGLMPCEEHGRGGRRWPPDAHKPNASGDCDNCGERVQPQQPTKVEELRKELHAYATTQTSYGWPTLIVAKAVALFEKFMVEHKRVLADESARADHLSEQLTTALEERDRARGQAFAAENALTNWRHASKNAEEQKLLLQGRLHHLEAERDSLRGELAETQAEVNEVEQKLAESQGVLATADECNDVLKAEVASLRAGQAELLTQLHEMEAQRDHYRKAQVKLSDAWAKDRNELALEVSRLKEELNATELSLDAIAGQCGQAERELNLAWKQVDFATRLAEYARDVSMQSAGYPRNVTMAELHRLAYNFLESAKENTK